jgi:hypothetical protein
VQQRFVNRQDHRSFVEVVKEDLLGAKGGEGDRNRKALSMAWVRDKEIEVEDWLSRSAIRKLKEFGSIDQVSRNLEVRGVEFSFSYMGGKCIVWTFGSTYDRVGFINNGFFWRNCFSTMME